MLRMPSKTTTLDKKTLAELPNSPGVYYFYGANDVLLYVGKSKQLRTRVLSHFSAAKTDSKERKLTRATQAVDYQITCGELGALLLESQEIKRLKPLHNRRLRRQKQLYSWALSQTSEQDFYRLQLAPSQWPPQHNQTLLGLYASAFHAKEALQTLAQTQALCPKILGLEKRQGACFAYQLKRCRGACIGEESSQDFNQRLLAAFAPHTIAAWPFEGPVVVTEQATRHSKAAHHVINQWYYLGNVEDPENFTAEEIKPAKNSSLDKDVYRILLGFLLQPDMHQLQIRQLSDLQPTEK
jgi:hypothetical protein